MPVWRWFLNLFRSRRLERELDDEIGFHLEERASANRRAGMDEQGAQEAARRQFGDIEAVKAAMREARMMNRSFVAGIVVGALMALGAAMILLHLPRFGHLHRPEATAPSPEVFRVGQKGVKAPILIHEEKPKYTPDTMAEKISGTVLMECVVRPDGRCHEAGVARSLDPRLDAAAMQALESWRFQPGTLEGRPVATLVTIEMAYTLR